MSESPNTLHAEDWAGEIGERWLANLDPFEGQIAPVGDALFARAGFAPGEHVIDIGCGGGGTTIRIARAVAPGGSVLGLDISQALVDEARRRAQAAGATAAAFTCADAAAGIPEGAPFDRLYSRFGTMFFADPKSAFANLHAMLRPGGRIDISVWAPAPDNPWMMETMGVVARHIALPPRVPGTPGPFAFGDTGYLLEILAAAGFSEPDIAGWEGLQPIGGPGATPAEAAAFITGASSVADTLKAAGPEIAARVVGEVAALYARFHRPGEGVMMGGKAWLVTARA
ncbi:class I SAM-dependent methyltransferase [Sphingomonas canadensis]|uniref:Class I SAM-dependent methyltransferase n=1 Tax=Sphingomonas canadensis TaxID=1219257 RepID=A0ABW3H772_9SPHN|nr:methyltransferase domain-containing protein [Sphingomonas canadensis]MCW3836567.1 methyltransferase domain-containing protein [Sphingomonas canadensis]